MLLELKIRLTKPFLGHQYTRDQIRRFIREGEDIALNIPQWMWAFTEASTALRLRDLDLGTIRLPVGIKCPRLDLYTRTEANGRKRTEQRFEIIQSGTILTMPVLITKTSEDSIRASAPVSRPPSIDEVSAMLTFIGEMLGLSPYGSKMGYGRFYVESLLEK